MSPRVSEPILLVCARRPGQQGIHAAPAPAPWHLRMASAMRETIDGTDAIVINAWIMGRSNPPTETVSPRSCGGAAGCRGRNALHSIEIESSPSSFNRAMRRKRERRFASETRAAFKSGSKAWGSTMVRHQEEGSRGNGALRKISSYCSGRKAIRWCYKLSRRSFHAARQLSSTDRSASASVAAILLFLCVLGIACEIFCSGCPSTKGREAMDNQHRSLRQHRDT